MSKQLPEWVRQQKAIKDDQAARREAYDEWARREADAIKGMIAAREKGGAGK